MNKTAVALAADSATTITRKTKIRNIYNTANKLFSLSDQCPVGIMFNGAAELNGVPWESIIKIYKKRFFKPKREGLNEYANDFTSFLNNVDEPIRKSMFPDSSQNISFTILVISVFERISEFTDDIVKNLEDYQTVDDETKNEILNAVIKMYFDRYQEYPKLIGFSEDFGQETLAKYKIAVQLCADEVFKSYSITSESNDRLEDICANIAYKDNFINPSGVIIAGFGDNDIFPSYVSLSIDAILNDKLKYKEVEDPLSSKIDHINRKATIMTFAQDKTVMTFLSGIDPGYQQEIYDYIKKILTEYYPIKIIENLGRIKKSRKQQIKAKLKEAGSQMYDDFINNNVEYCKKYHVDPVLKAVETLSKEELAKVAETLVNLESFKKRMSMDDETVGGVCDVAVVSKSDGFIWIKRKQYFETALNPQHIANFYKSRKNMYSMELIK